MPRERNMLAAIERATRQTVTPMYLPTREAVVDRRTAQFKQRITDVLGSEDLNFFTQLVAGYAAEHGKEPQDIAAALAYLAQKDRPLQPPADSPRRREELARGPVAPVRGKHRDAEPRSPASERPFRPRPQGDGPPKGAVRYRIEVGHEHGVQPGNIVGAIANEAGIDAAHIGRINIFDAYSTVDLPEGMPRDIQQRLRKAWVCGQQLGISVDSGGDGPPKRPPPGVKAARLRDRQQRPHRKRSHE
jgi:ATP-dependent RNA helicase DeaD